MDNKGKNYKKLFDGLCDVLAENSQPLTEEQKTAVIGFIDVLTESIDKKWNTTLKNYLLEHKDDYSGPNKEAIRKRDEAWTKSVRGLVTQLKENFEAKRKRDIEQLKLENSGKTDVSGIMKMLEGIKGDITNGRNEEAEAIRKEFEAYKKKAVVMTSESIKLEKEKNEKLKKEYDEKSTLLEKAKSEINKLKAALRNEQLKLYLEGKVSGLPEFEANLIRKRFASATSEKEIDDNFQKALTGVMERRSSAMGLPKPTQLQVQTNQICETAKDTKKVNLLSETTPAPQIAAADEDDFTFIEGNDDEVIPQADMAVWMRALGD